MRVGIHQINYFPWMGYFNKIAKSDKFILMDEVQLTDSGMMQRNRILNKSGDTVWITIAFNKKDYLEREFRDLELNNNVKWQQRQYNSLFDTYHKLPAWKEVFSQIEFIFNKSYNKLQDVNVDALYTICNLLEIDTSRFVYMSNLNYDREAQKTDLVLNLCKAIGADVYLSGNGAKKYMDVSEFIDNGINVQYQKFEHPIYEQKFSKEFIPGLSILDVLFNCGIENTKKLFWDNLCSMEVNE